MFQKAGYKLATEAKKKQAEQAKENDAQTQAKQQPFETLYQCQTVSLHTTSNKAMFNVKFKIICKKKYLHNKAMFNVKFKISCKNIVIRLLWCLICEFQDNSVII